MKVYDKLGNRIRPGDHVRVGLGTVHKVVSIWADGWANLTLDSPSGVFRRSSHTVTKITGGQHQ